MKAWSAHLELTPMAGGDTITLGIEQGSLAGSETSRPRYVLRASTAPLTLDQVDTLDPRAGVWVDLHVTADLVTRRRARLMLSEVRVSETGSEVMTDIEAVSVDALVIDEPPLWHTVPQRFSPLHWLSWAQQQGYIFNTYDAGDTNVPWSIPHGWGPERGQTIDEILDEFAARVHAEWFGTLEGTLRGWPAAHTSIPRNTWNVSTIDPSRYSDEVTTWETSRALAEWNNGALILHRYPDGREISWRVTQGPKDSSPIWRFYKTTSESATGGMVDTVAEQLTRTSARADTVTLTLAARSGYNDRVEVGHTLGLERPSIGLAERLYIVASMTQDLYSGSMRLTLRDDIVRLARIGASNFGIWGEDIAIGDAQQIIGGHLAPLGD